MTKLRWADGTLWRRVGPEVLVTSPLRDDVDQLSETAGVVWEFLDAPRTRQEVTVATAERYGLAPDDIAGDVAVLLEDLARRGWVAVVDAGAESEPAAGEGK